MARNPARSTPTLSDVARHAGVSLATASRDLSRKGYIRFSSEEWRRFRL